MCTGPAFGDPKACDIIKTLYERTYIINNYQADITVKKHDPDYLGELFQEARDIPGDAIYDGKISFYRPNYFNLMLGISKNRKMEIVSDDGVQLFLRAPFTVNYQSEISLKSPDSQPDSLHPLLSTEIPFSLMSGSSLAILPSPIGAIMAFEPANRLLQSPVAAPTTANSRTFNGDITNLMHAMNLVFPYNLRGHAPEDYIELKGSENVYGEDCYVLNLSSTARGEITLWVNKKNCYVMRVEYSDPDTGRKIDGYFNDFEVYRKNGNNYHYFRAMEVTMDNRLLYSARFSHFEFNIDTGKIFGFVDPSKMWKFSNTGFCSYCRPHACCNGCRKSDPEGMLDKTEPFFKDLLSLYQNPLFVSVILSYVLIFILIVLGHLARGYGKSRMTREIFRSE